jgi:multidrug efflux pump subunit AcrA (membrane-fusion protein)
MSGMTGEMNVIAGQRENALVIPSRAVLGDRVFVVKDDVVKPRAVKVGFHNLEHTEIIDGLKEGEQVVVADQDLFKPGQRVRAVTVNM